MENKRAIIRKVRSMLEEAVEANKAHGMLFSGGLDTGILLALNTKVKAITVSLESFGKDSHYAGVLVRNLGIRFHHQRVVSTDEAIASIPDVIRVLGSFDPAIPNDLAVYFGLKAARDAGLKEIITGDGADELFAGYDFMKNMKKLDKYIRRISSSLVFNSNELGKYFGISIKQPYLQKEFAGFAAGIPVGLKVRKEGGELWGKWILRKAFEDKLPREIVWQAKRPLEYGSGMSRLREIISSKISDEEFEEGKKGIRVKFMNKEHFYYYRVYMNEIGQIPKPVKGEIACPGCGAGMGRRSFHCKVCGHVLNRRSR